MNLLLQVSLIIILLVFFATLALVNVVKLRKERKLLSLREIELKRARQAVRFLGRANGIANTTFMDTAMISTLILLFNEHFPDLELNLFTMNDDGLVEQVYHDKNGSFHALQINLKADDPSWLVLSRFTVCQANVWQGQPFIPNETAENRWLSSVPLFAEESLVGTMLIKSLHPLNPSDQALIFDISNQLAAAIYGVRARLRTSRLRQVFSRAVDPQVMEHLLASPDDLGGAALNASVLFLDIRDFTSFSERNSPEYVVARLNDFFMKMEACISAEGGLINKFTGDGFLALFGAPVAKPDHAQSAIRAAIAMIHTIHNEPADSGEPPFRAGIGIASGIMVCGTIGSPSRLEFTVIGDTVNTASRIESMNKFYGSEILVTRPTLEAARSFGADSVISRFLGPMKVKGKDLNIDMFEILGNESISLSEYKIQGRIEFESALAHFHAGDLTKAGSLFQSYLSQYTDDTAAKHLLETCLRK